MDLKSIYTSHDFIEILALGNYCSRLVSTTQHKKALITTEKTTGFGEFNWWPLLPNRRQEDCKNSEQPAPVRRMCLDLTTETEWGGGRYPCAGLKVSAWKGCDGDREWPNYWSPSGSNQPQDSAGEEYSSWYRLRQSNFSNPTKKLVWLIAFENQTQLLKLTSS